MDILRKIFAAACFVMLWLLAGCAGAALPVFSLVFLRFRLLSPEGIGQFSLVALFSGAAWLVASAFFRRSKAMGKTFLFTLAVTAAVMFFFYRDEISTLGMSADVERNSGQILPAALQPGRNDISVLVIQQWPSVWPERLAQLDFVALVDCVGPDMMPGLRSATKSWKAPKDRGKLFEKFMEIGSRGYDLVVVLDDFSPGRIEEYLSFGRTRVRPLPCPWGVALPGKGKLCAEGTNVTSDTAELARRLEFLAPELPENSFFVLVSCGEGEGETRKGASAAETGDPSPELRQRRFRPNWWLAAAGGLAYAVLRLLLGRKKSWDKRLAALETGISAAVLTTLALLACRQMDRHDFLYFPVGMFFAAIVFSGVRVRRVWARPPWTAALCVLFAMQLAPWMYLATLAALLLSESWIRMEIMERVFCEAGGGREAWRLDIAGATGMTLGLLAGGVLLARACAADVLEPDAILFATPEMYLCAAGFLFFRSFYLMKL